MNVDEARRQAHAAYMREYNRLNSERIKADARRRALDPQRKEKRSAQKKLRRACNLEHIRELERASQQRTKNYPEERLRREKNSVKADCHPERAHQSKGLCKACYMKQYLANYVRPKESLENRKNGHWARQGIAFTVADYDALFYDQGGVCAICHCPPVAGKSLSVDHDHDTGRVRGLLCDYCNRRLLIKKNTPEILERAASYLRKARES